MIKLTTTVDKLSRLTSTNSLPRKLNFGPKEQRKLGSKKKMKIQQFFINVVHQNKEKALSLKYLMKRVTSTT